MFKKIGVFIQPIVWRLVQSGNKDLSESLQAALVGYTDMIRLCLVGGSKCCRPNVSDDMDLRDLEKYFPSFHRRQGFYMGFKHATRITVQIRPHQSDTAIELAISFFTVGEKNSIVRHQFLVKNKHFTFLNYNEEGLQ